mmetsp:Transcript_38487/g.95720  ORF Transcript_38487/g.95720 Transcript_38487/m.95720 type:complete len:213 (-) Transcript_38487:868-1506(-)
MVRILRLHAAEASTPLAIKQGDRNSCWPYYCGVSQVAATGAFARCLAGMYGPETCVDWSIRSSGPACCSTARSLPAFARRRKIVKERAAVHAVTTITQMTAAPNNSTPPWKSPLPSREWGRMLTYSSLEKRDAAMTPHAPQAPCTAKASSGSSILHLSTRRDAKVKTSPPMLPWITAAQVGILLHPAVIETSPARMPLHMADTSQSSAGESQ